MMVRTAAHPGVDLSGLTLAVDCEAHLDRSQENEMPPEARDLRNIAPSPGIATQQGAPTPRATHDIQQKQHPLERIPDCTCHDEQHDALSIRADVAPTEESLDMLATSKYAERTVMPFLAEHLPTQYNMGVLGSSPQQVEEQPPEERTSTRYCYRHRPDMMCRRQANEPSMALLQKELGALSHSDQQAISHVWSLFSAAPSKHRNLMLQGILTQCCFPQLSYISANVRELIKVDFLAALPAELGFKILCYLDTPSLCKAAQVSWRWRSLADDDVVWHKMCEQHIDRKCTKCGWGLPLLERKRLIREKKQIQLRASGRAVIPSPAIATPTPEEIPTLPTPGYEPVRVSTPSSTKRSFEDTLSPEPTKKPRSVPSTDDAPPAEFMEVPLPVQKRPWKDVYKDRFRVGTNWRHGRFTTKVFKGHTNGVMCLQFDDKVLISGSYDTTAKVWDIQSGQLIRTLRGHQSGIRCLQFDETKLMTGSLDHSIKLWNWKTGQCLRTFPAHNDGITCLHFSGPWVASGSMDQTIRVWNSETQQTFLLRGHSDWINSVKVDVASRTLFSASDDLTVKMWDLDTKQPMRVFEGHVGQVQQVLPLPAEFELDDHKQIHGPGYKDDDASSNASGHSFGGSGRNTPELENPFWPGDPERAAPPRYMLTGALDSTIRLWDVHFNPHNHPVEAALLPEADTIPFKMLPTDPLTNSHTPRAQACLRTFFGHVEGIWALAADHLRLISGSEDRMMKVWDPRTGKCERTFTGHRGPVTCTWLSDSRVASGSEDCEVRMLCFGDA